MAKAAADQKAAFNKAKAAASAAAAKRATVAANLAKAISWDVRVPEGFVLARDALALFLAEGGYQILLFYWERQHRLPFYNMACYAYGLRRFESAFRSTSQ